jgi:hypothetical protein
MLIRCLLMILPCFLLVGTSGSAKKPAEQGGKFYPDDNSILVLAGQSLRATLDYYESKIVPRPAGFTDYISYDIGASYGSLAPDYPKFYQGNDALLEPTNWGAGIQCVSCNLTRPDFAQAVVAIGMYIAGPRNADGSQCRDTQECNTYKIAAGIYDQQLKVLAEWLKTLDGRPVFLRIGYEFDGGWNNYEPKQYKQTYKYIYHYLNKAGVDNVAFVWQSFGYASMETLAAFYPERDEFSSSYVDWVGYSYFHIDAGKPGVNENLFAKEKGLKTFVSEVAPHTGDCKNQIDLAANTELARQWVENFFEHLAQNRDVIGGLSYINENWSDRAYAPQWQDQQDHNCGGYFSRSNSRLQDNPVIEKLWAEKISAPQFLNWRQDLYRKLR